MTKLELEKLNEAFESYCLREYEDTVDIEENEYGIFYSDYEDEDRYAEIEVKLYANDHDCEYVCWVDGKQKYSEHVTYEQAIAELESCSFDDFYSYFCDESGLTFDE